MSRILVTGASGHLGRLTLQRLLERRPAADLVGLARDPGRAADLAAQGIEVRAGDYADPASLTRAFAGVEQVLLVPTHAFADRVAEHANVIAASRADLAEAQAVVLTDARHAGATYALHGAPAVSFADVAEILAVPYVPLTGDEYLEELLAGGLPGPAAAGPRAVGAADFLRASYAR